MPYKPDWIEEVGAFARQALPDAPKPAQALLDALPPYARSKELGGPECAAALRRLGDLRKALGLRTTPNELEALGWSLATF